jgi:hypothetical protein
VSAHGLILRGRRGPVLEKSTRDLADRRRRRVSADGEEVAGSEATQLAKLQIHVRLILVAGGESDLRQRVSPFVEQR